MSVDSLILPEHLPIIFGYLALEDMKNSLTVCKQWATAAALEMKVKYIVRFARENLHESFRRSGINFNQPLLHLNVKFDPQGALAELSVPNVKAKQFQGKKPRLNLQILIFPYCKADGHPYFCQNSSFDQPIAFQILEQAPNNVTDKSLKILNSLATEARKEAMLTKKDWFTQIFCVTAASQTKSAPLNSENESLPPTL